MEEKSDFQGPSRADFETVKVVNNNLLKMFKLNNEYEDKVGALQAENAELQANNREMQAKLKEIEMETKLNKEELAKEMEANVAEQTAQLRGKLRKAKKKIEKLNQKMEMMKNKEVEKTGILQKQLSDAEAKMADRDKEVTQVRTELEKMAKQLNKVLTDLGKMAASKSQTVNGPNNLEETLNALDDELNLNKKVFVGGVPGDFPEEELRKHFEQFGRVKDVEWPFDKMNNTRKNFAFVVFETEDGVKRAAAIPKQQFANKECDVKKAVPQKRRNNNFPPRGNGNMRGGAGGFADGRIVAGMRSQHQQMPMYHQNQWYPMNAAPAWYNAAYNGDAMYDYGHGGQGIGANGNNSVAHWYNSGGANGHGVTTPQANQWYGNGIGSNGNSEPAGTAKT